MTKQEILKKFPYAFKYGVYGSFCECTICAYFNTCDKILPGVYSSKKMRWAIL